MASNYADVRTTCIVKRSDGLALEMRRATD